MCKNIIQFHHNWIKKGLRAMGQIFYAVALDVKTLEASCIDADKFHANCYSYSGAVCNIHYLLRQKPMNVVWLGHYYAADEEQIKNEESETMLKAISALSLQQWKFYDQVECVDLELACKYKVICQYTEKLKPIISYEKALNYFNWEKNHSPEYKGFLINHTKKTAINLKDYYRLSVSETEHGDLFCVDPIPLLTATADGAALPFLNGITAHSTLDLAETWRGDLLQICDAMPVGIKLINCAFAPLKERSWYCYNHYGVDEKNLIKDVNNELLSGSKIHPFYLTVGPAFHLKAIREEGKVKCSSVPTKVK